jgi:signal transduction histidine kinase/CheY-like chemotaxis protein
MLGTCTLLIVDDCAEDRAVCRRYLSKDPHQSYKIFEADSAESGLELWQQENCDVILLDFCLPTMSGLEFLDRLKQQQPTALIPVIFLTGYGAEEVAVQAMKLGVQDYLIKQQLNPDLLQRTVRTVIQHCRSRTLTDKAEQRLRLTNTIALQMRQSLEPKHVIQTAVGQIQQVMQCGYAAVYQVLFAEATSPTGWQKLAEAGQPTAAEGADQWFSLVDQITQLPSGLISSDAGSDSANSEAVLPSEQVGIVPTRLVLPIVLPVQKLWGIFVAESSLERQWQSDDVETLKDLVGQLALALQQAEQVSQMQVALEQAQQLSSLKSQMIATVSHEYLNPLTAILVAASTLKRHGEQLDPSKHLHFLDTIEDKARFMARLVENLLVLEKLELGKVKFNPLPFNLLDFVADLIEEQRSLANGRQITFQISGNTKGFWGDQDLLQQILVNLLSNAVKYSPAGEPIEVRLSGNDSHLVFSVQDQGIGIPLADQEKLFQSFSRASNVDTIAGTGLGLAITKACVELHGGTIQLKSTEGIGTTVIVELPKRLR